MLSSFLEDFDRSSLSRTCSMMNLIIRRKSIYLFNEKEEQNMLWDSCQIDKWWINVKTYPIKFKDELETIQYFTEGWNKNEYLEDQLHDVYYYGL